MCIRDRPDSVRVLEGAWWSRAALAPNAEPVVALNEETAKRLGVQTGSWIQIEASGRTIQARVVALFRWDAKRLMPTSSYIFNPPALAGLPASFDGGVRIRPASVRCV